MIIQTTNAIHKTLHFASRTASRLIGVVMVGLSCLFLLFWYLFLSNTVDLSIVLAFEGGIVSTILLVLTVVMAILGFPAVSALYTYFEARRFLRWAGNEVEFIDDLDKLKALLHATNTLSNKEKEDVSATFSDTLAELKNKTPSKRKISLSAFHVLTGKVKGIFPALMTLSNESDLIEEKVDGLIATVAAMKPPFFVFGLTVAAIFSQIVLFLMIFMLT
jgi:hypothetical protein